MKSTTYFKGNLRKWFTAAVVYILLGGWCWYMFWASSISHNTVLKKSVPEWKTYILSGLFMGVVILALACCRGTFNKNVKSLFNAFSGGFILGFVLSLNCYDVYVYLFPDKVIGYESEYEVVFPGPSRGKYGHCEAGLWLKDPNTSRWKQLCINKEYLHSHRKQGMTGVWVTARVNNIGSYIVRYEFIYR